MTDVTGMYQLPDDIGDAGEVSVESDLIDLATGVSLIDESTQEQLTGETLETRVFSSNENIVSTVACNDEDRPALINITNRKQSEVDVSLLGIDRSEVALVLFDTVNVYGVNTREWASSATYTYSRDPGGYTFNGSFGYYTRHLPSESAIQVYTFPRPKSFTFPVDDNTGRFPGGYTDGVMTASWESKRAFRYQPGRVTGFTLGVKMSTLSDDDGEVIKWGCRNDYGDGYFFQLEKGTDLYIIRTSPDLGELKVPRDEWNGDKLFVNTGRTGWGLDLSRVTMFKIEFSWYGAVGAQFLAYVPDGNGEARWVRLHSISAENRFEVPSLRSAYLRLFTSCTSIAGATKPAFINLYGSSVYIDGGDKGTVTLGTAAMETPKNISSTSRSILGLNVKATINGVNNQKAVYPVGLSAFASTPTRFDIVFRDNSCAGVQYGYGPGTALSRGSSSAITVSKVGTNQLAIATGTFPDISQELIGSTNYLSGRRVRVVGNQVFNTHVTAISPDLKQITTDQPLPNGLTSIRLSRFNAYAVGDITIASGVTNGSILRKDNSQYWRIGLWPEAAGTYDSTKPVAWTASAYSALSFSEDGIVDGEIRIPFGCNESSNFSIAINNGTNSYTINAGGNVLTVSGSTNPWPIAIVAELMDGANISDLTIVEGTDVTTVGVGATKAIPTFAVSGVSQAIPAGGADYLAHKFENVSDPLSAVLADVQGLKVMTTTNRVATVFVGSGETKQFDLTHVFGPDKMFITGAPNTAFNTGGLFVVATARVGSGIASAMLNWEEQ